MSQVELPAASTVADAPKVILNGIKDDREFPAFKAASLEYSEDWQCFTGFPVVANWNLEADARPLFEEGLRALALKAAVYAHIANDQMAEIPIAVPVDEMTHAMLRPGAAAPADRRRPRHRHHPPDRSGAHRLPRRWVHPRVLPPGVE
ncbi:hypothetical protein ACIQ9J_08880 [Streptomyces sp. NPDC094153]|uniref:hypothetical protein n=1 Tax=Streptomyces sp. NPDC094153 TaxID=3366058 RepID=UPI0037F6F711